MTMTSELILLSALSMLASFAILQSASAQDATAENAPASLFSVRDGGPTVLEGADVFELGSNLVPVAGGPAMNLPPSIGNDINAFSQPFANDFQFLICFSVDADSLGGPDPINFALPPFNTPTIPTYNVTKHAGHNQQAGDAFISTEVFNRQSIKPEKSLGEMNNVLVINQSWSPEYSNGFNFQLPINGEQVGPDEFVISGTKIDDLDGGAGKPPVPEFPSLFFTVTPDSPSLPDLPRTSGGGGGGALNSPADVFLDLSPQSPGGTDISVFASAAQLGLITGDTMMPGDVIDGVVVFDDDSNGIFDGTDEVFFSLAKGSPTLDLLGQDGATLFASSASDALSTSPRVFIEGDMLGLPGGENELNMVTLVTNVDNALETIRLKIPSPSVPVAALVGLGLTCQRRRASATR